MATDSTAITVAQAIEIASGYLPEETITAIKQRPRMAHDGQSARDIGSLIAHIEALTLDLRVMSEAAFKAQKRCDAATQRAEAAERVNELFRDANQHFLDWLAATDNAQMGSILMGYAVRVKRAMDAATDDEEAGDGNG
jgi:hypothetical protein